MKEKAIQFGASGNLTGVMCEPGGAVAGQRPGVVLLNSGILHRVGACRLHVRIARALAAEGFTSLRFDFSGIGDSEPRQDALPFEESAPLEVIDAMDHLARVKGSTSFILAGLCSGADAAFHTAARDARVAGLCQLDAWPYRTWRHYVHHYAPRMRSAAVWKRFFLRNLRGTPVAAPDASGEADLFLPTYVRVNPPQEEIARHLDTIVKRGTRLLHIYSGGQPDYNYRRQFQDAFSSVRFGDRLQVEYIPQASHIFTGLDHQVRVVSLVRAWALAVEGVGSARQPEPAPALARAV
jgi:pimeloyl-ACP methyl ester carboxylesterase